MCVQLTSWQDLASAFLKRLWALISATTPIELQVFLAQLSADIVREAPRYPLTIFFFRLLATCLQLKHSFIPCKLPNP
jgi:hypothetical protein